MLKHLTFNILVKANKTWSFVPRIVHPIQKSGQFSDCLYNLELNFQMFFKTISLGVDKLIKKFKI